MTRASHLIVGLLITALCGCASYRARSISATVVDSNTGSPIEGVHVAVVWKVEYPKATQFSLYAEGSYADALLTEMETITDSSGSFRIPEWDSATFPTAVHAGVVTASEPAIYLFKSGYRMKVLHNTFGGFEHRTNPYYRETPYRSEWDGKTISLERLPDNISNAERARYVYGPKHVMIANCAWKAIPNYLSALIQERERIRKDNPRAVSVWQIPDAAEIDRYSDPAKCGRAADILKQP